MGPCLMADLTASKPSSSSMVLRCRKELEVYHWHSCSVIFTNLIAKELSNANDSADYSAATLKRFDVCSRAWSARLRSLSGQAPLTSANTHSRGAVPVWRGPPGGLPGSKKLLSPSTSISYILFRLCMLR